MYTMLWPAWYMPARILANDSVFAESKHMPPSTYPQESTQMEPQLGAELARPQSMQKSSAELHSGVVVIPPRGKRPYALRYKTPDGASRQPQLPAGLSEAAATQAAVHLSALLRLGLGIDAAAPALKLVRPVVDEQAHRGVQVIRPREGRPYYALRYTDPVTRECKRPRLAGVTTDAGAHAAAVTLFRSLQERKDEVTTAGGREHAAAVAVTVREESATYVADVARKVTKHGRPTSPSTIKQYSRQLEAFAVWCDVRGITRLRQLERSTLKAWIESRLDAPVCGGKERKRSTVNQEVKPVRQMLIAAAQSEHLHLSSDVVRGALKRRTQTAVEPRCLEPDEIRATLQAALDYDVRPDQLGGKRRPAPLAPVVAVALLSGMRRGELAALQCREVIFNARPKFKSANQEGIDIIDLPGSKTKTGAPRTVPTTSYSPLLGELLQALTRGRPKAHRVFGIGYQRLGDAVWTLRKHGAPADLNIKMLRSTCATCQLPLPADIKAKAERLGHTLAVAEAYYLATPTGLPGTQPNLEAVMECEEQVREVIQRVLQDKGVRS